MKRLLLSSNSDFVIDEGIGLFFPNPKEAKIAYVMTASKGVVERDYIQWHKDAMVKAELDFEEVDVEGKTQEQLESLLEDKDIIFVEGGNTFYLLKAVLESGFDKVVQKLIANGVIYIGSSAGSYIACPTIEMATWKPKKKDRFGITDFTAMNLVPFLVVAHYKPEYEELLKEKVAAAAYPVKILLDGQAIVVKDEEYTLIGKQGEIKL